MKIFKRLIIAIVIIILITNSLFSQNNKKNTFFSNHPIDLSFGNILVGIPFSKLNLNPSNFLASAGTEFYYNQKPLSDFFQTINFIYYHSEYSTSALIINSEIGYRYFFNFGLFTEGEFGIGYSHLFNPSAVYKQDENGKFKQAKDWGTPRLLADFSFSIGYKFNKQKLPSSLYLKYGNYLDLFYAPDIPALPHNSFQIGARFIINDKSRQNEL